jgi:hypothetical protein
MSEPEPVCVAALPETAMLSAWEAVKELAAAEPVVAFDTFAGPKPEELPPEERRGRVYSAEGVRFKTGAVRSSDAEATRYDLISPIGLEAVARTCAEGAAKYGEWNWEKGMPVHDLLNHVLRHINMFLAGDRCEPHLPHAAWGLLAAIHSYELWPHLNEGTLRSQGCKPPLLPPET